MSKRFATEQEEFWAGPFGDEYVARNSGERMIASNAAMFTDMLDRCPGASSLIELGSNIGQNLRAIRMLRPDMTLDAVEINATAVSVLESWGGVNKVHHGSILDFEPQQQWDIALIKGVLIHIHPDDLRRVYDVLFRASRRYILIAEYYNPTPVEVRYRGHEKRLFKRDFAGEMLDLYPQLAVVDYGFVWRRDPVFAQDDVSWFVLEKR
jgi:spore coat polysaccharide biosynthesis protein SpsF